MRHGARYLHGVPMLLVHVVARLDTIIPLSQVDGFFRVALQVHRNERIDRGECEDLSGHAENQHIRAKGSIPANAAFGCAIRLQIGEGHGSSA